MKRHRRERTFICRPNRRGWGVWLFPVDVGCRGFPAQARIQKFFKGEVEEENFGRKMVLIHVSTRVHIKNKQTCTSFSLFPRQEDCLLFFALFYYSLFIFEIWKEGCNPCNPPPLHPPMQLNRCRSCSHDYISGRAFKTAIRTLGKAAERSPCWNGTTETICAGSQDWAVDWPPLPTRTLEDVTVETSGEGWRPSEDGNRRTIIQGRNI